MKNRFNRFAKIGGLTALVGAMFVSPVALAKEGEAHVPGIGKVGGEHWVQRVEVSGVLETEYGSSESFTGTKSSNIGLATVELAFDAKVNKNVNAHLSFLYEEGDTAYDVDEGYIDIGLGNFYVQAGRMYVPFGSFETNVVSDPLTLEIGETQQTVLRVGGGFGDLTASVYMFNGTTKEAGGDDVADQMGARINYLSEGKGSTIDVGVDYINNLDSGAIIGHLAAKTPTTTTLKAYVPATVIYANLSFGSLHVIFEHLSTDQYDAGEVAFKSKGATIAATNIEVGYDLSIAGVESTVGLALQTTEEALALGLPEEKMLIALSMGIYDETALSFEYATSTDYAVADGGTGKDATSYTVQLAVGF